MARIITRSAKLIKLTFLALRVMCKRAHTTEAEHTHVYPSRRKLRQRISAALQALQDEKVKRRVVVRAENSWRGSTLYGYVTEGDNKTYTDNFRMTMATVKMLDAKLSDGGFLVDNKCRDVNKRITSIFKVAVCLYFLAQGGTLKQAADCASIGWSTAKCYLDKFCAGVLVMLKPIYMSTTPPTPEHLQMVREEFGARRGITEVAMATDGTHVPFNGGVDYRCSTNSIHWAHRTAHVTLWSRSCDVP